jgi:serine/threonine-protein kinase RsbW
LPERIFEKVVQSDPGLLPELEEFIIGIAEKYKLDKNKFNNLVLSFSEAVSNSILHGNKLDKSKKVFIKVIVDSEKMTISIKDEGTGFDLKSVPDPTKLENILKDSGRGIHIMKSFVDNLHYNFTSKGTEAILEINLK